jgi:glycosyltransferase involved in cell wall biosynthesis
MGASQGLSLADARERGHDDTRPRPAAPAAPMVSAVIPTLNEAGNIGRVLRRLPPVVAEVILVDGLSSDGTIEAARAARPDVVVVRARQRGKGAALQAGFAAARGEIIVMLDADCSMDPAEIDRFVAALGPDVDLVKGSRFLPGAGSADITPLRRWGNGALLALVNHLYGARLTDLCYGFIAFRRAALAGLRIDAAGFEVETQIAVHALQANMRIAEAPSFEHPRHDGVSKLHPCRDGTRVLWTIAREHRAMRRAAATAVRVPLARGGAAVAVTASVAPREGEE